MEELPGKRAFLGSETEESLCVTEENALLKEFSETYDELRIQIIPNEAKYFLFKGVLFKR